MENTLKNIQTVAFFFFFTLGLGYLMSSLLALNDNFLPTSETVKQALFLPCVLTAIAYMTSSILQGLASDEKSSRMQTAVIVGLSIIVTVIVLGVYFAFPNIV
ncbi:MAG: hypothetical protein WC101_05225 [Candidatus Gracilibacteria bacterium]